jgi:hypothetical protein
VCGSLFANISHARQLILWEKGTIMNASVDEERSPTVPLERELATYQANRPTWVREGRIGKWVLIHGGDAIGFYPNFAAGLDAGYEHFGLQEPFMVREIVEVDKPIYSSRRAVDAHRQP